MPTKNTLTEQRAQRAAARGDKDLEKKNGLAAQLRELPYTHPLRVAYLKATPAGSPAGSAPKTIKQLLDA